MAARPELSKAAREAAAKHGFALPNGKYPIRSAKELRAAIFLRHKSREPYGKVKAHIMKRAKALGIDLKPTQLASAGDLLVFACHSKACAPPPVGSGGSNAGGAKGTNAMTLSWSELNDRISMFHDFPRERMKSKAEYEELMAENQRRVKTGRKEPFEEITAAMGARGDSKPVSSAEFQALANQGQDQLDSLKAQASPIKGLDKNWDQIKSDSYDAAQESWGGATIDAHTGQALGGTENKYALTVKDPGISTVSVAEGASRKEFDAAMDRAKEEFRSILERKDHYLGVFHDDDLGRIDIDPVLVVNNVSDVHTIGSATRAVGGAYNFADGNGYWPPHVRD